MISTKTEILNAILVGVPTPETSEQENQSSLDELARLVHTLGYHVVGRMSQKRKSQRATTVLGDGRLAELAKWTGGTGTVASPVIKKKSKAQVKFEKEDDEAEEADQDFLEDELDSNEQDSQDLAADSEAASSAEPTAKAQIVIFDCDLSPSQLRNVESATGVSVLDRTGVIIEIFSRHAKTRAARLQVEIAKLTYVAPRLRETGGGEDRGGGGVGGKGAGESSLELDKRKIRDRIKELKTEFASIENEHQTRRSRREKEITVALVGYTNAGKSSLMRAMTGSDVLVADKLFATLDTTVRPIYPETRPKILLSDTVGFIKKLPHNLVASFKSTLDEALNASLLLFVVDASDPSFRAQLAVTKTVLAEVGAGDIPSQLILNKRDRLSESEIQTLREEFPKAWFLSSQIPEDLQALRQRLVDFFESDMVDMDLLIPYVTKGAIGEIRTHLRVLNESYLDTGVKIQVRGKKEVLEQIKKKFSL